MPPKFGIGQALKREEPPPWFWPSGLLLTVGLLECAITGWFTLFAPVSRLASSGDQSNGLFNIASPSGATWKPSASQYCVYIGDFNKPPGLNQTTTFMATLLANSAPTPGSHAAALRLYDAVHANKVTQADVNAVNSAYACPSTSTTNLRPGAVCLPPNRSMVCAGFDCGPGSSGVSERSLRLPVTIPARRWAPSGCSEGPAL